MKTDAELLFNQLRELIKSSCSFQNAPSEKTKDFHSEFLKLHFGVMDVKIDYKNKSIVVWSPKPINPDSFSFQNINQCVTGKIDYDDLEATLLGCIETDDFHSRFYQHFLLEYGETTTGAAETRGFSNEK